MSELHTALVFAGGLSLAEYDSANPQSAIANPQLSSVRYVRGPDMGGGVGGLLYSYRSSTGTKYTVSNGRGDTVGQSSVPPNPTAAQIAAGAATFSWTASYETGGKRAKTTGQNADRQRGNSKDEETRLGLLNEGFRYRDTETMVWLSRDPAGFVDGPNLYAYVKQNPWTAFDPLGLEPVRDQAGTIDDFVRILDASPKKQGIKKGSDAMASMRGFGKWEANPKTVRIELPNTGWFNTQNPRYIYTKKGGWLDMAHFMFYAGVAYNNKLTGVKDPVGEAVQRGYLQEKGYDPGRSKYSYEDLPTDKYGAIFGAQVFNPFGKSAKKMSLQIADYIQTLEPTVPNEAPNYATVPQTDVPGRPPSFQNKTTTPMFTKEDKEPKSADDKKGHADPKNPSDSKKDL